MTAEELRAWAAELRKKSLAAAREHAALAAALVSVTGKEHLAISVAANVNDCMARRYRQWAEQLEMAAAEIED